MSSSTSHIGDGRTLTSTGADLYLCLQVSRSCQSCNPGRLQGRWHVVFKDIVAGGVQAIDKQSPRGNEVKHGHRDYETYHDAVVESMAEQNVQSNQATHQLASG